MLRTSISLMRSTEQAIEGLIRAQTTYALHESPENASAVIDAEIALRQDIRENYSPRLPERWRCPSTSKSGLPCILSSRFSHETHFGAFWGGFETWQDAEPASGS